MTLAADNVVIGRWMDQGLAVWWNHSSRIRLRRAGISIRSAVLICYFSLRIIGVVWRS